MRIKFYMVGILGFATMLAAAFLVNPMDAPLMGVIGAGLLGVSIGGEVACSEHEDRRQSRRNIRLK
jgi:hypothetical protein